MTTVQQQHPRDIIQNNLQQQQMQPGNPIKDWHVCFMALSIMLAASILIYEIDVLTKGDNNYEDDRVLYNPGQQWIHNDNILGRAVGYLPYAGMATIIMNDYPLVKYVLIGFPGC